MRVSMIASMAALMMNASPECSALTLSMEPATQTTGVGGSAVVNVNVSDPGQLTLAGYGLTISYNQTVVGISLADVSFGDSLNLGDPLGSDTSLTSVTGGAIDLFELSFVPSADLIANQPGSFTIATLTFTGLTVGVSPLLFTFVDLTDETGATIDVYTARNGEIRVTDGTATVPETMGGGVPALAIALLLFGGALLKRGQVAEEEALSR